MNKILAIGGVVVFAVASTTALTGFNATALANSNSAQNISENGKRMAAKKAITIWRDPNCGCCDTYADYLEANGYTVTRVDDRNFDQRSVDMGVPERGIGCHLSEVDGYVVSGLVPAEIIERLVTDRPNITGITLPGMPRNAPGMARTKTGTLKTYAFGEGGVSVYSNE
ncbi:DUF411 domain-containing protein [Maritalea sp.]|jgi:hypothetical protein|uniref:DUF411 domain-containing protein n=1 Tax=Maritalea sp. TaxID=2003361 RepID=UPI0039E6E39F